jgi:hypothetical protein
MHSDCVDVELPELARVVLNFCVLSNKNSIIRPPFAMVKLISLPHVTDDQAPEDAL